MPPGLSNPRHGLAPRSDGVVLLPRHLPAPSLNPGQQREPQIPGLPIRHLDGADQPASRHGAAAAEQGAAHCRQQRAQAGRRPAQGVSSKLVHLAS